MGTSEADLDRRVRVAAFRFLEEQTLLRGEVLPRGVLADGFLLGGQRVPLIGPQGIFKPAVLPEMPLSITTVPVVEGRPRPYDDRVEDEGLVSDPRGEPVVPNGLALCKLHHAAFDCYFLGVRPDFTVEIRPDVLAEPDGPMLRYGLQGFHDARLVLPRGTTLRPNPDFVEERYAIFRKKAG